MDLHLIIYRDTQKEKGKRKEIQKTERTSWIGSDLQHTNRRSQVVVRQGSKPDK